MRRNFGESIGNGGGITRLKPRRTVGKIMRLYWLQSLAFVAFLAVLFLFAATGHIGN